MRYTRNWFAIEAVKGAYKNKRLQLIEAVKIVRAIKKIGIKDAQEIVENWT